MRSKSKNGDDKSFYGDQSIHGMINNSEFGDNNNGGGGGAFNDLANSNIDQQKNNKDNNNLIWEFEDVPYPSKTRETSPVARES